MAWNADLGARHLMNWKGFLKFHRLILKPLAKIEPMGYLQEKDIDKICSVVKKLEAFKPTKGQSLVFGSKAAHFHFPGLVPVMSKEVREGLYVYEKKQNKEMELVFPNSKRCSIFDFTTPENRFRSYRNYIYLGNYWMKNISIKDILGKEAPKYSLNAKIYEWSIIMYGLK